MLGYLYYRGLGLERDRVQSYARSSLAWDGGVEGGNAMMEILAKEMTPEQVSEAEKLAKDVKERQPQPEEE